jgi:hypothetical protein
MTNVTAYSTTPVVDDFVVHLTSDLWSQRRATSVETTTKAEVGADLLK